MDTTYPNRRPDASPPSRPRTEAADADDGTRPPALRRPTQRLPNRPEDASKPDPSYGRGTPEARGYGAG
jgi:hypothetical protein